MKNFLTFCFGLLSASCFFAQTEFEKRVQTQLILAENGDTIDLPAGKFQLLGTLSLDDKRNITLRGAGQGKTILSFRGQKQGAEGLKITNAEAITLTDFTIEDAKGDLIKTQAVRGIVFKNITARWSGKAKKSNGAYALYPVQCQQVTIENCTAIGASDAGIYVGQSDSIWVRGCTAIQNVAGIEIENSTNAWVYDNLATDNAGGILVFDLPDLPKKNGGNVHVFKNVVKKNNHRNFAPRGNIVGKVPPGTGMMILGTNRVFVHDNLILENRTASCAIVSYFITEIPITDNLYNPYPSQVEIRGNTFSPGKRMPKLSNKMGLLFFLKFGKKVPHILFDGIEISEKYPIAQTHKTNRRICILGNQNGTFANLKADKKFKGISKDVSKHDCRVQN